MEAVRDADGQDGHCCKRSRKEDRDVCVADMRDSGRDDDDDQSTSPGKSSSATAEASHKAWFDDQEVVECIRQVETLPPAHWTVSDFIGFYERNPTHPILLSCLADSLSKLTGGLDPLDLACFFEDTAVGRGRAKTVQAIVTAVVEAESPASEDREGLLPKGVTGKVWGDAITAIFNTGQSNLAYCHGMGSGTTDVADFIRLAAPLKHKGCKTADLVPLFSMLWKGPILHGEWTDGMHQLHSAYMQFIEARPWLSKALDPGFIFVEGAPAHLLAGWVAGTPLQADAPVPAIPGIMPAGLPAAPVPVAGFDNLYRVADLGQARLTMVHLRQRANSTGHPNARFFGIACPLGNCTYY